MMNLVEKYEKLRGWRNASVRAGRGRGKLSLERGARALQSWARGKRMQCTNRMRERVKKKRRILVWDPNIGKSNYKPTIVRKVQIEV